MYSIIRRGTRRPRIWTIGLLFLIYYCVSVYSAKIDERTTDKGERLNNKFVKEAQHEDVEAGFLSFNSIIGNKLMVANVETSTVPTIRTHPTWRPKRANCTPPAIEQFPKPLMYRWYREHGGLVLHVLVAIFTFFGLAIVCKEYFVASVERLCEELELSPDVAGATFMAVGSSAPGLAFVVMGVFFAQDDIGIDSVIGSAVFNTTFVISMCALCTGTVCQLKRWPLMRDCVFYCLSIVLMLVISSNDVIYWFESVVMLLCYVGYCVALHFNTQLERWASPSAAKTGSQKQQQSLTECSDPSAKLSIQPQVDDCAVSQLSGTDHCQENLAYNPDQPESVVVQSSIKDNGNKAVVGKTQQSSMDNKSTIDKSKEASRNSTEGGRSFTCSVFFPIHFLCQITIPDCRTERYSNRYPSTFIISMIWISLYSYLMIWMITVIGSTLAIPDAVMSLTFVAAGVSVPVALSSIAVFRKGFGDMAVSNAIGSNVFLTLVCLGLPWFIQTTIIKPGSHVNVISKGLLYSALSPLLAVIFLILSTLLNGWKLNKRLGIILMLWYLIFIIIASLYQLNVFGLLNPPECASDF